MTEVIVRLKRKSRHLMAQYQKRMTLGRVCWRKKFWQC